MIGTICDTFEVGILIYMYKSYKRTTTRRTTSGATVPKRQGGDGPEEAVGQGSSEELDSRSRRGSGARVPKTQWGESPEHVCLHESFVQKPT